MFVDITRPTVRVAPALDKEVIPLSSFSAHANHVHKSWPASIVQRATQLATFPSQLDVQNVISKYEQCNASFFSLSVMRRRAARVSDATSTSKTDMEENPPQTNG